MTKKAGLLSEIRRHLLNIPLYAATPDTRSIFHHEKMDAVNHQIEETIAAGPNRPVFLVGPFGSGKTTQLHYFFSKHPELCPRWHSFNKITSLDFAFANVTKFSLRMGFFVLIAAIWGGLFYLLPAANTVPAILVVGLVCTKPLSNLMYLFHEIVDSVFRRRPQIIVIEDLERSPLKPEDQWAFLCNLWSYKRIYIVTLGYPSEAKEQLLRFMEMSLKLGGTLIELRVSETSTYEMIKKLDPDFPFRHRDQDIVENRGWLSLFTYREMLMLQEQVFLRTYSSAHTDKPAKQLRYVEVALELLLAKLELSKREISFVRPLRQIRGYTPKKYSEEQRHYLESFIESIEDLIQVEPAPAPQTPSQEQPAETPAGQS